MRKTSWTKIDGCNIIAWAERGSGSTSSFGNFIFVVREIIGLFASQYNSNDISNYPNITIDRGSEKQYVCDSFGYKVYTIELREVYFKMKDAETIELYDALTTEKLTIEDMTNVCKQRKK